MLTMTNVCYICNSVCNCGLTDCQKEYDRTFEELIKDQLSYLPPVPYKGKSPGVPFHRITSEYS